MSNTTAEPPATKPTTTSAGRRNFLVEFVRKPNQIGAIAPSSPRLARAMVSQAGVANARTVVEFGPGTGAFSGEIMRNLRPGAKYFAIELSPLLAEHLQQRHPNIKVHVGSAADVGKFCEEEGWGREACVDVIVSGLPWASFPEPLQRSILEPALKVLKPGGVLVTFGYHMGRFLPAGKRFAKLLPTYFSSVKRAETVWLNLPPAFVYRCEKAK